MNADNATYFLVFEHGATGEERIVAVYGADGMNDTIAKYQEENFTYRGYSTI